jgi:hypothetical protein
MKQPLHLTDNQIRLGADGIIRLLRGHCDATFVKTLSLLVILSDLLLSIGGFALAQQFERRQPQTLQTVAP